VRVTGPLLDVLDVLLAVDGEPHGWAIMRAVRRSGPTVYGVLDRLEGMGWVDGRWEDSPEPGKPRRRLYRLTGHGAAAARQLLTERRPTAISPRLRPGGAT
jgi:PadR family transcriptional regulator, regulatory protein PadR